MLAPGGRAFNEVVRKSGLKIPVVSGRDHLDSDSVAVSDWPLFNAMLNVAGGDTWVSLHHMKKRTKVMNFGEGITT